MHIRCKGCHGTLWVESTGGGRTVSLSCKSCGQDYVVPNPRRLRAGARRLAEAARRIAEREAIDLPGAYSVLLGVMRPQEVREVGHVGSAFARTGEVGSYDPAFQPAIEAGCLSSYQAAHRGKRKIYTELLSRRYGLPMDVAFDVADNRVSLLSQLRGRVHGLEAIEIAVPRNPRRDLAFGTAFVLAMLLPAWRLAVQVPALSVDVPIVRTVQGARVLTDSWGRALEVAAPDPRAVLVAYCASHNDRRLVALDLVPSARHGADVRLGVFRDASGAEERFLIEIAEDRAGGRWVAGDGARPILERPVPPEALSVSQQPGHPQKSRRRGPARPRDYSRMPCRARVLDSSSTPCRFIRDSPG